MNSFISNIKTAASGAASGDGDKNTELLSNAKLVAEAAQSATTNQTDKFDKPKVVGADEDKNTELLSSAKLVAEAAQNVATNQTNKIDKPKVAGAAGDLLDSVKLYGKFDESQGVGQYMKQADDYLHQYEKSGATGTQPPAPEEKKGEAPSTVEEKKGEAPPATEEKGEKKETGGGFGAGDAFKAAGSLFK